MTDMNSLYSALSAVGLSKRKLRPLMPDWWSAEIESTPTGAQQGKFYLAKALSLRLSSFSESPPRVEFELPENRRFKLSAQTTESEVQLAVALARSASQIALSGLHSTPYIPPIPDAGEIRQHLLTKNTNWVDLETLVDFCWDSGIPVIHLATPLLGKKMDGIAMSTNGRPSIVLSNKKKHGFLLFHLAHELGHIALGHVTENSAVVDDNISEEDSPHKDQMERDADSFAIELLTGNNKTRIQLKAFIKSNTLARLAIDYGRENKIDPSHVLLNAAHNRKDAYPLCIAAVKLLRNKPDQALLAHKLFERVSDEIKPDSEDLLRNLVCNDSAD